MTDLDGAYNSLKREGPIFEQTHATPEIVHEGWTPKFHCER